MKYSFIVENLLRICCHSKQTSLNRRTDSRFKLLYQFKGCWTANNWLDQNWPKQQQRQMKMNQILHSYQNALDFNMTNFLSPFLAFNENLKKKYPHYGFIKIVVL